MCSVQCSTAGAGTETGGRHGCDAVAMHASRYADVMQQKRRRAVVVLPGLGDGLSAAAGCGLLAAGCDGYLLERAAAAARWSELSVVMCCAAASC